MKLFIASLILLILPVLLFSKDNNKNSDLALKKVYAIHEDKFIRIPPPRQFLEKSATSQMCSIHVNYNDFPDEPKAAFEYAVSIWETLLQSDQVIYVEAYWREIQSNDDDKVLGSAGSVDYHINKEGIPIKNVFFNSALAEKLAGRSINSEGAPDIIANFNSTANWYYGTDGETPAGKFDLATVVLHELCHGLGFTSSMDVNASGNGTWGFGTDYPFAFDRFLVNGNGDHIIDQNKFPRPSKELYNQLVSDNLFFDGPVLDFYTNSRAKLYVPNEFDGGSSISHLDEKTYDDASNGLMTPGISSASSIHDPGIIAMSMMKDAGWDHIDIQHEKSHNREEWADVMLEVVFKADFETELINPRVTYAINGSESRSEDLHDLGDGLFSADIEVAESSEIDYYFSVEDKYGRTFYHPGTAPEILNTILLGPDQDVPEISHFPNSRFFLEEDDVIIWANINDLYGVDTAFVEYKVNGEFKTPLGLRNVKDDIYNLVINFEELDLVLGDSVEYRIVARDIAEDANVRYHPSEGYHKLSITQVPEYAMTYENTFESKENEFILDGFTFSIADGFDNAALNSRHPYKNGGEDTWLNFTAELKFPIKIADEDHFIEFDEIALVEPGEEDAVFGDDEFWDYVVVEATADSGNTWIPLKDGWDSRLHRKWAEAYDQSLHFNNTEILEELDLYVKRGIDLTGPDEFSIGDIIRVRFRLHSDPYAVGWGWAIDNLKIQTLGVDAPLLANNEIKIYPNPITNGELHIEGLKDEESVRIFNLMGKEERIDRIKGTNQFSFPIPLNGLYIVLIESDKTIKTEKVWINSLQN